MAKRIQQQRSSGSGSRDNGGLYDTTPDAFSPAVQRQHEKITGGAQNTISNIDDVLAENDKPLPDSAAAAEKQQLNANDRQASFREQAARESWGHTARRTGKGNKGEEESEETQAKPAENKRRGVRGMMQSRAARRTGIAAIGGGVATGGILLMLNLVPLKMLSLVTNLQENFSAATDQAGSKMGDQLFKRYLIKYVIPGMRLDGTCSSTLRSRSCAALGPNNSPVSALYYAWRDSNLEGKLARNYGLEVVRRGDRFYIRSPRINGDLDLGTYDSRTRTLSGKPYAVMNRSDVRREVRRTFENETLRRRVLYRYSVGKLLERKYGVRRCIVACEERDRGRDKFEAKKRAFKLFFVERIILPRSEMMGLAVGCALSNFDCTSPGDADEEGERKSKFQRDVSGILRQYRENVYGKKQLAELDAETKKVEKDGITKYIVKRLAGDAVGDALSKIFSKAVPIVGWIDGLSNAFELAQNAGPAIKQINYVMNSATAVQFATMMLSNVDEQKSGKVDATEQGSMLASLSADPTKDQGGGPIEDSPLYDAMFENIQPRSASLFDLINPRTYAQGNYKEKPSDNKPRYKCQDGKAPSDTPGQYTCPEVGYGAFSLAGRIAIEISNVANNPALSPVNAISEIWQNTVGAVLNWVSGKLGDLIGGVIPEAAKEAVMKWIKDNIIAKFFIDMIGENANPAPARLFEVSALGFEAIGNDAAQFTQGGRALTDQENSQIRTAYLQEKRENFEAKPLYARLFDTTDNMSMVSRIAFMMPTTRSGAISNLSSIVTDPFRTISSAIPAGVFSGKARAYSRPIPSFSGVPTYGYPLDSPVFQDGFDPEKYWKDNNCDNPNLRKEWGAKATEIDPNTILPVQRVTEPCLLIRSEVAAAGAQYDTSLLVPDPQQPAPAAPQSTPAAGGALQTGTAQELAAKIKSNPNISFQTASGAAALDRIIATGRARDCGAPAISPTLLGVILKLAESYKLVLGVMVDDHVCDTGTHPKGAGVDINGVNPLNGGVGTGNNIRFEASEMPILTQFYQTAGQVLSSVGRGGLGEVTNCISPQRFPNVTYFNDTCNHIHLDVRTP